MQVTGQCSGYCNHHTEPGDEARYYCSIEIYTAMWLNYCLSFKLQTLTCKQTYKPTNGTWKCWPISWLILHIEDTPQQQEKQRSPPAIDCHSITITYCTIIQLYNACIHLVWRLLNCTSIYNRVTSSTRNNKHQPIKCNENPKCIWYLDFYNWGSYLCWGKLVCRPLFAGQWRWGHPGSPHTCTQMQNRIVYTGATDSHDHKLDAPSEDLLVTQLPLIPYTKMWLDMQKNGLYSVFWNVRTSKQRISATQCVI